MKKLLIDAGNTRLKWVWHDQKTGLPSRYKSDDYDALRDQGADLFKSGIHAADEVAVCGGGKEMEKWFIQLFAPFRLKPKFARSVRRRAGVTNGYKQPGQLGADRWMALLGAWQATRGAVCVVDCGTAVTIDALDGAGRHLGGLITPGMTAMLDTLAQDTGLRITDRARIADGPLAADTDDAVMTGVVRMLESFIELTYYNLVDNTGLEHLPLILTGGDGEAIQSLLGCKSTFDPMLVFKGMAVNDEAAA